MHSRFFTAKEACSCSFVKFQNYTTLNHDVTRLLYLKVLFNYLLLAINSNLCNHKYDKT